MDPSGPPPSSFNVVCAFCVLSLYSHLITYSVPSDPNEQAFFWASQMPEKSTRLELLDGDKEDRFYIDAGNMIRFRVESDEFIDEEPGPPKALEGVRLELVKEAKRPPYSVIVGKVPKH